MTARTIHRRMRVSPESDDVEPAIAEHRTDLGLGCRCGVRTRTGPYGGDHAHPGTVAVAEGPSGATGRRAKPGGAVTERVPTPSAHVRSARTARRRLPCMGVALAMVAGALAAVL